MNTFTIEVTEKTLHFVYECNKNANCKFASFSITQSIIQKVEVEKKNVSMNYLTGLEIRTEDSTGR